MAISILLYAGFALLALGSISLAWPLRFLGIATRLHALVVFGTGLVGAAVALLLPPPSARGSARGAARIDEFAPRFQFEEFHERIVRAAPERVFQAIHDVPAGEIRLFRLLTWIRSPRLPGTKTPESILNSPAHEPILATALKSGFVLLAEEKDREIVLGTLVARRRTPPPRAASRRTGDSSFRAAPFSASPGWARSQRGRRANAESAPDSGPGSGADHFFSRRVSRVWHTPPS